MLNEDWGSLAELQQIESRNGAKKFAFGEKSSFFSKKDLLSNAIASMKISDGLIAKTNEKHENEEEDGLTDDENTPSKIKETPLPTLMANPPCNMIVHSQSGTGKTAAFLLASLNKINLEEQHPQVLILSPTYELALQTGYVMAEFCTDIKFRYAVNGAAFRKGETVKEHIVIGTPGNIFDWIRRYYFDIKKIRVFVLDEADVMISTQGLPDQCLRVHTMLSGDCQMLLFSAAYPEKVMNFAEQIISHPIIIRLHNEEETVDSVQECDIPRRINEDKYEALQYIFEAISNGQFLIYCRKEHTALWLVKKLHEDGHSVCYLFGDLTFKQRRDVITSFREGKEKVMITTNGCDRGLHMDQVTLVINYDLLEFDDPVKGDVDCGTYLHQKDPVGHFGKSGF